MSSVLAFLEKRANLLQRRQRDNEKRKKLRQEAKALATTHPPLLKASIAPSSTSTTANGTNTFVLPRRLQTLHGNIQNLRPTCICFHCGSWLYPEDVLRVRLPATERTNLKAAKCFPAFANQISVRFL